VEKQGFGRHRKIMPFEPDSVEALRDASRQKAASLNQHVLGYGAQAEAEWAAAGIAAPDLAAMRKYRLERIRAELKRRNYAGALLYDPVNIRYATDSTNMQLWVAHNPTRHCFVATEGPVVLFDYFSCEHLSDHSGVVDEVRPAVSWMYLYGGELTEHKVRRWAAGIADLVKEHGGGNSRIAVDHINPEGVEELARLGISIGNGEAVMENARLIKSPDEILAMRRAIVACEAAMGEMEQALSGKEITFNHLVEAVIILIGMGHLAPAQSAEIAANARQRTDRLNARLLDAARGKADVGHLASPITAGGISVTQFQQLFLLARARGCQGPSDWAQFAWHILRSQSQQIIKKGKLLETPEQNLAELSSQATAFAERLPLLTALQVA